jgi:drug/metabolite transporter (DMT)-like permease
MTKLTQPRETSAIVYALCAVLLWSTVATGFKLGLEILAVAQLLLIGTAISWFVFLCAVVVTRSFRMSPGDFRLAVLLGVLNPWAYYLILFSAYDRLPAHIAQPLNYTWAIKLALLAVPVLKQKLTPRAGGGILLSYVGVVALLNTATPPDSGSWDYLGVVLALTSTLLWAVYWLVNTRSQGNPASMMFVSFSAGLLLVFVTCVLGPGLPALTSRTLTYGAWVGVVEMGITFLLWQQALRRTANTAKIGQLIFLSPFISLVLIHFVLGEQISIGTVGSLVVIVIGIAITQSKR